MAGEGDLHRIDRDRGERHDEESQIACRLGLDGGIEADRDRQKQRGPADHDSGRGDREAPGASPEGFRHVFGEPFPDFGGPGIHSRPDQPLRAADGKRKAGVLDEARQRAVLADFAARGEMAADGEIGGRPNEDELPAHARLGMAPPIGAPQIPRHRDGEQPDRDDQAVEKGGEFLEGLERQHVEPVPPGDVDRAADQRRSRAGIRIDEAQPLRAILARGQRASPAGVGLAGPARRQLVDLDRAQPAVDAGEPPDALPRSIGGAVIDDCQRDAVPGVVLSEQPLEAVGDVVGLVRVHHWCGNDPVGEHIARVDLSLMLTFLQQGERLTPLSEDEKKLIPPHFSDEFSDYGWRVGEFGRFKMWCDYLAPANAAQENHGKPL